MLFSLLTTDTTTPTTNSWYSYIVLGVILVIFVVGFILTSRKSKKKEEETKKQLDAIKPGSKVTTIGGICGTVIEVNAEDDTFVMETGSEGNKCYLKFLKQAIYQTDAGKTPAVAEESEGKEESQGEAIEEAKEDNGKTEEK